MAKAREKKPVPARARGEAAAPLRQALARRKKAELVDVLVELAQADRGVLRQLTARFDVALAIDELVAATRQAIVTHFDQRDINRNFAYDSEAYGEVKRNLDRLVAARQWRLALQLALELMEQGSHQVSMSDEGLMAADIEDCIRAIFAALPTSDLPAAEVSTWCAAMRARDQVGFIAQQSLQSLHRQFQAAAAQPP
jgi:uncharacterized Zn finger protein